MKKVTRTFFLAGLLILLLCAGRFASSATAISPPPSSPHASLLNFGDSLPPAHFWQTQRLTSPAQFSEMGNRSLALDAAGYPHIVYGINSVYYAWYDGSQWHREIVDEIYHHSGADASLALDHNGIPHIVYIQRVIPTARSIRYATKIGGQWYHLALDSDQVGRPTIAVDSSGYPHIVYGAYNRGLLHFYQTSSGWFQETIDSDVALSAASLVIDGSDTPHVSYLIYEDTARYATKANNQWIIEAVQPVSADFFTGVVTSIALDNSGRPAMTYQAGAGIQFATRSEAGWSVEAVNDNPDDVWFSLALDAAGIPHLAYYDSVQERQLYATRPAVSWLIAPVDSEADSGRYSSIALDQQGQPHISYGYYGTNELDPYTEQVRYAQWSGNQWVVERVDSGGRHSHPRLAIGSDDRLRVIYQDLYSNEWRYRYQTDTSWLTESIGNTSPSYDKPGLSYVLDSQNEPHFIYYDREDTLRYIYRSNGQWHNEIIFHDAPFATGWPRLTAIALDDNQEPHIAFYQPGNNTLFYAYREGIFWTVEPVDTTIDSGLRSLSLQLDTVERPHLAYQFSYEGPLRYAHRPADQWLVETITDTARAASLVLDSQDRPHITHSGEDALYYTTWTGADWSTQVVDTQLYVRPEALAILLDSSEQPHIAYQCQVYPFSCLKQAYYDGSDWHVHQIAVRYSAGYQLSFAANSQDELFILHLDEINGHLLLSQSAAGVIYSPLIFKP
jgi:hypothetical protein